jgi:hypothetical protein
MSATSTEVKRGEVIPKEHVDKKVGEKSSSYLIFLVVVFIVLTFITGVLIANTIYFSELRNQSCGKVPQSQLDIMYWLNLVLTIVAGILWLVILVLFFLGWWKPEFTEKYVGTYKRPTAISSAQAASLAAATRAKGAYQVATGQAVPLSTATLQTPPPARAPPTPPRQSEDVFPRIEYAQRRTPGLRTSSPMIL